MKLMKAKKKLKKSKTKSPKYVGPNGANQKTTLLILTG